jgi:hypothetical protein
VDYNILSFQNVSLLDEVFLPIRYSAQSEERYNALIPPAHIANTEINRQRWQRYKLAISQVFVVEGGFRLHLDQELCDLTNWTANICNICMKDLRARKIPKISIANQYDLGNPLRANLTPPTFVEELCLARSRILCTTFAFRLPRRRRRGEAEPAAVASLHGHTIAFPDTAADICGNRMPDIAFAGRSCVITLEGPRGSFRCPRLEGLLLGSGVLSARPDVVVDWLWFLKFMNPEYANINILDEVDTEGELNNLRTNLVANRQEMPRRRVF